jgi:hypothetical protein
MFRDVVQRYQSYDPNTRTFTATRTNEAFAAALGVHPSVLTRLYREQQVDSLPVARGLVRLFPETLDEVSRVFLTDLGGNPADLVAEVI